MAVVRNLMVRAGADFSGMRKEMRKANQSVANFKAGVMKSLKIIGGAYVVKKVIDYGRASVREYNAAAVAAAKLGQVMRNTMGATEDQIQSIKDLASAQQRLGVVHADIQLAGGQELGTYLSEVNSLKTLLPTLNDMLAQQYGLDATAENAVQIGTMIGKVMDGQLGALSRYGYSWTAAQEQMLKFGTEAQRAATLAAVVSQSVGGMNEALAKTPQGQMKQLAMTFADIRAQVGQGILPILQRILPYIQSLANSFLRAAQFVSAFTSALFGSVDAAKQTMAQANAVGALGDAYEEAGKQAKGSVSGFDQVNLVGGSTGGGEDQGLAGLSDMGGGFDGLFDGVGEQMSEVSAKAKEMADKVKAAYGSMRQYIQEHSDLIISALAGVGTALTIVAIAKNWSSIAAGLRGIGAAVGALFSPVGLIVGAIALLVGAFIYFYRTNEKFRDTVHNILKKIGEVAKWLWDKVLVPFGKWLADVFVKAWGAVKIAAEWLWKNVLKPLGDFLLWMWKNVLVPVGKVIGEALAIAFKTVADIAKSFWKNVLVPLGQAFKEILAPAVEMVIAVLKFLWEKVIVPLAKSISDTLKPKLKDLADALVWLWDNALKPVANYMSGVFASIFDNAFRTIGGLINGLKDQLIGLMKFITGVFTGDWEKAWEGVKQIIKGVFDSLWSIVKYPLNLIIDGINTLIKGLNKFSIDIPEGVPGFGGKKFGINIPAIPKLKSGGLAFGPTLAVVGDNRGAAADPEVIAPLSKLETMIGGGDNKDVVKMLERVERAVKEIKSIQAVISASEVTQAAVDGIENIRRRTGHSPIKV